MRRMRLPLLFLAGLLAAPGLGAQTIEELQFTNQPVTDILLSLAQLARVSIVPDETVTGNATYYFVRTDFQTALAAFLDANRLYATRRGDAYFVSRIRAEADQETGLVRVDAEEVDAQAVIRALSRAIDRTILVDGAPRTNITVHMDGLTTEAALNVLARNLGDYELDIQSNYFYLKRRVATAPQTAATATPTRSPVTRADDRYSIRADRVRALDALVELFRLGGREYSLLARADKVLENVYFADKSFDELLRLISEQANLGSSVVGGITYLFEIQSRDVLKRVKGTSVVPLQYLAASEIPTLLPQDLSASSLYRIDKGANQIILTGSDEEIGPLESFIRALDRPLEGRGYWRFDLRYNRAKDIVASLPPRLVSTAPIMLPDATSFVMLATPQGRAELQAYLDMVDVRRESRPIRLRHIRAEDLLKTLPPSVAKEDIVDSGQPSLVFYVGPRENERSFMRELELLDRPQPQITYQLLVIQYFYNDGLEWTRSLKVDKTDGAQAFSVAGALEQLIGLNFDIIAAFGYQFAASLSLKLSDNRAKVFADTTLNALSGQDIKFQNTNTFRFRDPERDPDTGEITPTGVTREITSGLIVDISGWVSGDQMITMTVSATVSKQGTNLNTNVTDLPPTTEKKVSTTVRTPSGQPVIIGGLVQEETNEQVNKVPVLGDIPLLGLLFRNIVTETQQTEFVIYILPHVRSDVYGPENTGARLDELYQSVLGDVQP